MGAAAENVTNGHAKQDVQCAAQTILGDERYELVRNAKLLVVGAGGIGCELLKNLVMTGFRDIEVIDLDTIDVSNLNRQFLFRRCHVDQPKSTVAAEAVKNFRPADPHLKIVSHHGNIKAQEYSSEWFSKFDAVLNALDNLEARRHVNRLCLAAERPLLEAGSTGHLGQVTVIKKGETECFECEAKPSQKVYPYCTIRSTPEKPVHCLVWAKNLFDLCFGPVDDSNLLSDLGEEMRQFRAQETVEGEQVGKKIFTHLFKTDVEKQAALEELWSEKRPPPTPLNFEEACTKAATSDGASAPADKAMLETQKVPAVAGDAKGFVAAVAKMYGEQRATLGERVFSKDDPVAMDFVHCAANLRMENYGIKRLSRWDAQSIAGSIIPAVASTNAIVAGLEVLQLLHVLSATAAGKPLSGKESSCRTVWVRYPEPSKKKILQPSTLRKPNPDCFVCGSCTGRVVVKSLEEWKIGAFVKACVQGALGAQRPNILLNGTCIYDPEYPEASPEAEEDGMHPEWSLAEWGLASGSVVQVEDEGQHFACNLILREDPGVSEELHPQGFHIEASVPDAAEQASAAKTRDAETGEPSPKRQATAADVQPAMVIDD